ncbi:hypothetical protein [Bailinhaonella thermotolerans]|uniref:Uncharacterized protein n=1 Tax=Bailinhaonella thermotolerans TaxID=1070861 RepID=A0A3A4A1M7_9ACTN|nr:hypothetical protein [Bailinhaonella thermotolerans]RJL21044.1 hypothetical protein D5H75_38165 [Bailinhaonella thermotolerans]
MTGTPLRGPALAVAAITHIAHNPDTWDQNDWRCRTSMCLAGHIAELSGGRWLAHWDPDRSGWYVGSERLDFFREALPYGPLAYLHAEPDDSPDHIRRYEDIPVVSVPDRANRLLGRTDHGLFDADLDLYMLWYMIGELWPEEVPDGPLPGPPPPLS